MLRVHPGAHVVAAVHGQHLADLLTREIGSQRRGDLSDGHAEIGGLLAIDVDLDLGLSDAKGGVEVDVAAGLLHLGDERVGGGLELDQILAADVELDLGGLERAVAADGVDLLDREDGVGAAGEHGADVLHGLGHREGALLLADRVDLDDARC
jgi:hypothetical protein